MNKKMRSLAIVAWVGSLWSVGLLVVPILFSNLPRVTAGMVAGQGFKAVAWVGIICALILLLSYFVESGGKVLKRLTCFLVLLMLLCILVSYFGITPIIETLKRNVNNTAGGSLGQEFGFWHAVSSVIYYIQCALGALLVWKEAGK